LTGPHDDMCVSVQEAYADDRCLCCGAPLEPFDDFPLTAIGEGVRICGFCTYRQHDREDVAPILLAMLVCRG
jgi:hypothetical protein